MKRFTPLKLRHEADRAASNLPALLAEAEKAAGAIISGEHRMRRPGEGDSFWQFRDYQDHDSPQDIDWRQSAKSERVFIRQKEKQNPQSVCLWCAGGPSMDYASRRGAMSKGQHAAIFTLALSLLFTRKGEHVSLIGGHRNPGRSERTLNLMGEQLIDVISQGRDLPEAADSYVPSGCTAIAAGDFLSPPEKIQNSLRALEAAAGSGFLIQVLDPAELSLPFKGKAIFRPPSGEEHIPVENVEGVREAYRARMSEHIAALRELCAKMNWHYYLHSTERDVTESLADIWLMLSAGQERDFRK